MAEPDPRDYALVPVEDLYEDNGDFVPVFRSAANHDEVKLNFLSWTVMNISLAV